MTFEMWVVIGLLLTALLLFSTERIGVDLTALLIMSVLLLAGVLTPEEGFSGFSNAATVTVAAMFVLSAALQKTGAVSFLAILSTRIFAQSYWIGIALTMPLIGIASAFINNTPVVAVFIPVLLGVARDTSISATRLLLPISFASMFGGILTLVGTSTNILVSSIAADHGLPAFGMFEFTSLGVLFFIAGVGYMLLIGVRMLPERRSEQSLTSRYEMADYLTDVVLLPEAPSVGTTVSASSMVRELDVDVLEVIRDGKRLEENVGDIVLHAGDMLRLRCDVQQIQKLQNRVGCNVKGAPLRDEDFNDDDLTLMEVIVAPNATLEGQSIHSSAFRNTFRATALALRHRGDLLHEGFRKTRLLAGDAILVEALPRDAERLKTNRNFVVASEIQVPVYRRSRLAAALLVTLGVIVTAALNILPISTAAVAGAMLLVATRSITLEEAYQAVEWKVIFLLGGIISLGIAMEKTGLAALMSDGLIDNIGSYGPTILLAALYLLTTLLTGVMSNNATAILVAPIALAAAEAMGISARPLLIAVTFAASASFLTPVGYQTNTMIFGVGQYRFSDFLKVGTPLTLLFWIMAIFLIPVFFPF